MNSSRLPPARPVPIQSEDGPRSASKSSLSTAVPSIVSRAWSTNTPAPPVNGSLT